MTPLLNSLLFPPLLLLTLSIQDPTEACSCHPAHPQEEICRSNIVISATILSKTVVKDSPSSDEMIRYEINQTKMFKGFEKVKDVKYVFTAISSAICGVDLKVREKKKQQYLLSGSLSNNGRVFIYLCNFVKQWCKLTRSQKINLNNNYQKGCDCKITYCRSEPCYITTPHECLWTDGLKEQRDHGHQAENSACFKGSDGTCSWHNALP